MYKVLIWESELGWGKKLDETKYFDTLKEAEKFVKEFNSSNNEDEVPNWYMYAEID